MHSYFFLLYLASLGGISVAFLVWGFCMIPLVASFFLFLGFGCVENMHGEGTQKAAGKSGMVLV